MMRFYMEKHLCYCIKRKSSQMATALWYSGLKGKPVLREGEGESKREAGVWSETHLGLTTGLLSKPFPLCHWYL